MKMYRLCILYAIIALGIAVPHGVLASEKTVLYENTFDSGTASAVDFDDNNGSFTFSKSYINSSFGENPGIGVKVTNWADKSRYVFKSPVSNGVVAISFDISKLDRDVFYANSGITYNELAGDAKTSVCIGYTDIKGPNNNFVPYFDSSRTVAYDVGKVYKIEQLIDFNNQSIYTYVDDNLLSSRIMPNGFCLKDILLSLSMTTAYFDNLKITKFDSIDMSAGISEISADGREIFVAFSDGAAESTVGAVSLRNVYTGESIEAVAALVNSKLMRVEAVQPISDGYEYMLVLSGEIKGVAGASIDNNALTLFKGDGSYIKKFRLKGFDGETLLPGDLNSPEISALVFEFSDGIDAQSVLNSLVFTDGSGKNVSYTVAAQGNIGEVATEHGLFGGQTYTASLDVTSLAIPYVFTVITDKGRIFVKNVSYTKNGSAITSAGELASGDKLAVTMEVIKSVREKADIVASAAVFNGIDMTDFDFAVLKLSADDQYAKTVFNFDIKSTDKFKFKTFIWKGIDLINPLSGEKEFK